MTTKAELTCTEPGCAKPGPFATPAGLGLHRRRAHAIAGAAANGNGKPKKASAKRPAKKRRGAAGVLRLEPVYQDDSGRLVLRDGTGTLWFARRIEA